MKAVFCHDFANAPLAQSVRLAESSYSNADMFRSSRIDQLELAFSYEGFAYPFWQSPSSVEECRASNNFEQSSHFQTTLLSKQLETLDRDDFAAFVNESYAFATVFAARSIRDFFSRALGQAVAMGNNNAKVFADHIVDRSRADALRATESLQIGNLYQLPRVNFTEGIRFSLHLPNGFNLMGQQFTVVATFAQIVTRWGVGLKAFGVQLFQTIEFLKRIHVVFQHLYGKSVRAMFGMSCFKNRVVSDIPPSAPAIAQIKGGVDSLTNVAFSSVSMVDTIDDHILSYTKFGHSLSESCETLHISHV